MSTPSLHFLCLSCDSRIDAVAGQPAPNCIRCGASPAVVAPPENATLLQCGACGHEQLYVQKDFNRTTGIVLVAIGAVFVPWTWGLSLLAVTILDFIVYYLVGDVVVCYECQAVHRAYPENPEIKPFDLVIHDRHVYGAAPPGAEEGHQ